MLAIEPYTHDDSIIHATRADGRARVHIYRLADPVVVLGRGSDPETELDLDACRELDIPIRKRLGGGCSVVIDPGNVIVSVAIPKEGLAGFRKPFQDLTDWLIAGLVEVGVPGVTWDGISDLVLDDRKVSGSCVYRSLGLIFYTATLLVEPDLDLVARCLKHPPREPDYRRGRTHADFMGRLPVTDIEAFESGLRDVLSVASLPQVQ